MTARKAHGHVHKHVSSRKHQGTSKHHPAAAKKSPAVHHKAAVHAKGKHPSHAKARGWARPGDVLPVCSFEVLAASLRLAGQSVGDDEVAWLWELAGAPALGAAIPAALDTAGLHGLAGFRPQRAERLEWLRPVQAQDEFPLPVADDPAVHVDPFEDLFAGDVHELAAAARFGLAGCSPEFGQMKDIGKLAIGAETAETFLNEGHRLVEPRVDLVFGHALILGVDLPGPHAVLATPDGWWSWGQLYDPWPCRIEEAWAVSWT